MDLLRAKMITRTHGVPTLTTYDIRRAERVMREYGTARIYLVFAGAFFVLFGGFIGFSGITMLAGNSGGDVRGNEAVYAASQEISEPTELPAEPAPETLIDAQKATVSAVPSSVESVLSAVKPAVPAPAPAPKPKTLAASIVIDKIGVNMPIVEGKDMSVLRKGAWRSPWSSTPDKGGNTVLFGHRYMYLPPHPRTFYSLDKLVVGDTFVVTWGEQKYTYKVVETKVVPPEDISVLHQTEKPTITLITCTPVFTTKNRLIIRAEMI